MLTNEEAKRRAITAIDQHKAEIIYLAQDILKHPETGWNEIRTSKVTRTWFDKLSIPYRHGIGLTGVKGSIRGGGAGPGPSVGLLAELDSLRVPEHPFSDPLTGAAHACGHHAQMGSMLGALIGLVDSSVLESLSGTIVPFAVPAEEFIEVENRLKLKSAGKIEFLGGKQELIKLGEFDDMDMAIRMHTGDLPRPMKMSVGGTCNGP
ncbi:MAG: Metal-dependent amidase/aminoacylase/carboxypeptidase [Chloroflexi bacterium]|nr:MAG: Metal-dependent amidase/aminoacylase/carboxypeptidase [Chloroflexota bacterium]